MSPQKINRITAALLVLGLGSALIIYVCAAPPADDPLRDDLLYQKRYKHELARYGGKMNVMSDDFMDWFDGLWHGRALAGTVAVLTLVGVGVFRFAATPLAPLPDQSRPPGKN